MEQPLTYNIDSQRSKRYKTVTLTIGRPESADPRLLGELMEDEREWQRRESKLERLAKAINYPFYRLRPLHAYTLLQKLAITQKLYFNDKRLMCDFFSHLTLEYLVEDGPIVHALLDNRELSEFDLILQGSPHIAIRQGTLRFIDPNVAWQDLAPFLDGPKLFTHDEYKAFKKEQDPTKIVELMDTKESAKAIKKPQAHLTDATCSFIKADKEFEAGLLEAGFTKKELGLSNYYCPTDRSLQAIQSLLQAGWQLFDAQGKELVAITSSELSLAKNFSLTGTISFGKAQVAVTTVAKSVQKSERLLPLDDTKTALLSFTGHKELETVLQELEFVSESVQLKKSSFSSLGSLSQTVAYSDPSLKTCVSSCFKPDALRLIPPKESFCGTLRPYQQEGLNWLIALYESGCNGLLADEMGLGKTVQVIAFLSHIQKNTLIVVPTSLLCNWQRELSQFLPSKSTAIYHGIDRDPKVFEQHEVVITSYGTLRSDIDLIKAHDFECVIADEAQVIKNSTTRTFQAVSALKSRFRLSLTGTPIENSLKELATHFAFLEPGLVDAETPNLKKKLAPFLLRRTKSQVAPDLPEKIEEVVWVTMSDEQQAVYASFMAHLKAGLLKKVAADGTKAHRMEIFEALLRLRQIACHPPLLPQFSTTSESAKMELVLNDIETLIAEGKKVVLFSQFTSILHLLRQEAIKRSWPTLLLEGQTKERQTLVDTFQNDPAYPLFLISLKAGGTGLNLTRADYVLLYDPWWNRAQENQAIDRAHRIGRKEAVFSKRYIVANTIEEKMLELQAKKTALAESLFDETPTSDITLDDLDQLLQ